MRKMKRFAALTLAAVWSISIFTGCGNRNGNGSKEIIVGATIQPHAEILNSDAFQKKIKELGYTVKVKEYTDYVQPNEATEDGSLDANFFQHQPFLDDFNKENKGHLVSIAKVHYEPYGLYAGKTKSLEDIKDGSTIAVPNDSTNEARALQMLEAGGIIKLKENAGLNATINDIVENPHNVSFKEIESAQTPLVLEDVDFSVINGNYAMQAGLNVNEDALLIEDAKSVGADTYANIVVVKEENKDSGKAKALAEAITCDEVKSFIEEKYSGAVIPVF
ncbi:MetQ/NlpA family ABC transporter substrate-binding protein [[Clostridium] polysaccharolyticum]|uniref:Lipoprotein n=2 Tax=[Clostridium] polysaccharolyticum TaxID=29364 RepID=A0A1I0EKC6_9FIRM|nr:MetQ/NlpA family ABC transporter substrate-binding protein [[Clostridium] polysaccharolyticum]SET45121.1 D-methionine transport system substrate-binding protein [[Clostridium] polysaccharolyticum]